MALVACGEGPADDADGDGVPADRDCDDTDPDVAPGRTEICDGIDQDCDGEVDEGVLRDYFVDEDRDGYGSTPAQACAPTPTLSITGGDCDDGDAGVRPGALETCDGVDQDCDDAVDEEASDATLWAPDADEDGFGSPTGLVRACEAPTGFVVDTTDCDDTDPTEYPGQVWYRDADADTFGDAGAVRLCARGAATDVQEAGDCDDGNAAVNPEGVEVCNTLDDDCDGAKDEPDAVDALTFYTDADKDGFGDAKTAARACVASDGQVLDATDCDDADATEYPGILWYPDVDGDGFGALGATPAACARAAITDVVDRTDCDDTRGTSFPGAEERCNDQDDDCDGTTDEPEAVDAATWYRDSDGDGFGDASATSIACDAPTGFLADDTDCDDRSRGVNPAAKERCDDVDEDCDGDIDEDAVDRDPYYADVDKDGYGDPGDVVFSCDEVVGRIEDDSDCDDTDAKRYPGVSWYPDEDGDGFGDGEATPADCEPSDPSDVLDKTDCDDTEADYKPGVFWYADADGDGYGDPTLETECAPAERSDVKDDTDCDDADAKEYPGVSWYPDDDLDGFGDGEATPSACVRAVSTDVTDDEDCDDTNDEVFPGADEICNDLDDDCDGDVDSTAIDRDSWYADLDKDGYGDAADVVLSCDAVAGRIADNTDCDDDDSGRYPGVSWYPDADGDGFGDGEATPADCEPADPSDVLDKTDCDDTEADYQPGVFWYADADGDGYGDPAVETECAPAERSDVKDDTDCDDADTKEYPGVSWYPDDDLDGFGDSGATPSACARATSTDVTDDDDCDDTNDDVFPGADEICNDLDDDCDGDVDGGAIDAPNTYADDDGDGYGDASDVVAACDLPTGRVLDATDCDDADKDEYPGVRWYADADGDGYGDPTSSSTCSRALSTDVKNDDDCDDDDDEIFPGATEIWYDGVDQDCDAGDDYDQDGDGFASTLKTGGTDCNDRDADIYPGAPEEWDGVDQDCDGQCDEGLIGAGDVVISEIMFNGRGSSEGSLEWFELHNPNADDIVMCSGWTIKDTTSSAHTVASKITIPAGGYVVFGSDDDTSKNDGVAVDYEYGTSTMPLNNGGDRITLAFGSTTIDEVIYSGSGGWSGKSSDGKSVELLSTKLDATSNDDGANWCVAAVTFGAGTSYGTPGEAGEDCGT